MRIPIIKVRSEDGYEHIVGENPHDMLYVDENGALQYHNIQCCDGTGPGGGYTFVGISAGEDEYSVTGRPEIEFVTMDELVEMEAGRLKKQLKVWGELREHLDKNTKEISTPAEERASDDTTDLKAKASTDDSLINPLICPVSKDVFCSISSKLFPSFANKVIRKIHFLNKCGYLRIMERPQEDCGEMYEFIQRVFAVGPWEECVINYEPVHPNNLYDPAPGEARKINFFYPLLTKIIVENNTDLINNMAHEKADRVLLAQEIKRLMDDHYYTKEELTQLEDLFTTAEWLKEEEKEKARRKSIEEHLKAMKGEGEMLNEKYGIQFEYHYAPLVSICHKKEKIDSDFWKRPRCSYISQITQDEKYRSRKEKYERTAALINAEEGKRVISSYYIKRKLFDNFIKDSSLTRGANPDKKYVAFIDKNNNDLKMELSHWTLVDVACCNDTLFASVMEAMREYVKKKGLNVAIQ